MPGVLSTQLRRPDSPLHLVVGYGGLLCMLQALLRRRRPAQAGGLALLLALYGTVFRAPRINSGSALRTLFSLPARLSPKPVCQGEVVRGYEALKELFEAHLAESQEKNAQLCVYVGGRKVVDLLSAGDPTYSTETKQGVMSCGKSISALAVAMLVDRGQLRYDQLVAEIWPELKANCPTLKLEDVLRHEAGLDHFGRDNTFTLEDAQRENIKQNSIGEKIAKAHPQHPPGEQRVYHGFTYGELLNEIVRRADPLGRTIGEFFHDEIGKPLGITGFIGYVGDDPPAAVTPLVGSRADGGMFDMPHLLTQMLLPKALSRMPDTVTFSRVREELAHGALPKEQRRPKPFYPGDYQTSPGAPLSPFQRKDWIRAEMPSANAQFSAADLARLGAALSGDGAVDGHRLLRDSTLREALGGGKLAETSFSIYPHKTHSHPTKFVRGGWCVYDADLAPYDLRGAMGWQGYGGACFMFHPGLDVAVGFAKDLLHPDFENLTRGVGSGEIHPSFVLAALDAATAQRRLAHEG